MKKTRAEKSRATVPLSTSELYVLRELYMYFILGHYELLSTPWHAKDLCVLPNLQEAL